jgi:hypothetical protein
LNDLRTKGAAFFQNFSKLTDKWKYYADQRDYIFGKEPSENARLIEYAANGYAKYLDEWGKIQTPESFTALIEVERN